MIEMYDLVSCDLLIPAKFDPGSKLSLSCEHLLYEPLLEVRQWMNAGENTTKWQEVMVSDDLWNGGGRLKSTLKNQGSVSQKCIRLTDAEVFYYIALCYVNVMKISWNFRTMWNLLILIPKDKREIKPLLLKVTAALAFSFASYFVYRRCFRPPCPPPPRSPRSSENVSHFAAKESGAHRHSAKSSAQGKPVAAPKVPINDEFSDSDKTEPSPPKFHKPLDREDYEEEVKRLRNMVRTLKDRETTLELQLLEYYGLKEQETTMLELQNRLKINNMESKLFTIKIETLQAENRRLEAQVSDFAKVIGELETARMKVKILRKKLRYEAENNKEQILGLQKRVEILQELEKKAVSADPNIEVKLKRMSEIEMEADELRKLNTKLKTENAELFRRLESTQILATSVLEDQQAEELRQESVELKRKNEELTKEIEQLQSDRCTDVEELVYLRWINACLRHELRNFQAQPGKTVARDLSKTLSPKSEAKAKQLILEYANSEGIVNDKGIDFYSEWSSSQNADCEPEQPELDDQRPRRKAKFLSKLRRLVTGKERHHHTQTDTIQLVSDPDSPISSTRTDFKVSEKSIGFASSPFRTSSLDLQSRNSLNIDDTKEISRMSSDVGSSSNSYRRYSGFRESVSDHSEHDAELAHKSELVKYAEALRVSGSNSKSTTPR